MLLKDYIPYIPKRLSKINFSGVAFDSSRVKKNNVTLDNIGAIMLSQIPGVSSNVAERIMQDYKTIGNLIEHLKENQEILNTIKIVNGDKMRKISKTTLVNINKFLIPEKIQEITIMTE